MSLDTEYSLIESVVNEILTDKQITIKYERLWNGRTNEHSHL